MDVNYDALMRKNIFRYILLECKETCEQSNRLLVNSQQGWKSDSRLRTGDHPADGYFCPGASMG